ncbi:MAG: glycosyltransferase family 4 protein [Candidatus Lokiarchaeota archaeon]|nr:glycosyltransferase family 4 protein [Candidatus Lokiarchaeota archaeon]
MQRIAELMKSDYSYHVEISTSNAIDFKSLRDSGGKLISSKQKYFEEVNGLKIRRFPIAYNLNHNEMVTLIKSIPEYKDLKLNDELLDEILKNGPFLLSAINYFYNLDEFKFDLIHTTYFPYFNIILSLILGKKFEVPVVITPFFHFSNPRYTESHLMEVLKKFDLLLACTKTEKEFLTSVAGVPCEKIRVIPMGVDFSKYNKNSQEKGKYYQFKQHYFLAKEKKFKMVLFCGYKNYEKGAISILKAIPYILEHFKKVYFVLIGPTTEAYNRELSKIKKNPKTKIINLTPDNLKGYFDEKKIAAFKETDIYLMPSRSDAFGISFLEAWAAGKPVIGAKIGATPEVIRNNIDGYLVNFDDPVDIANKVIKLLKKKRLRKRLGRNGSNKTKSYHTWDIIANMHNKIYEKFEKKLIKDGIEKNT